MTVRTSGLSHFHLLLPFLLIATSGCIRAISHHAPESVPVLAAIETEPVPDAQDAADDPAIWVHPTESERSLIIATNKKGGLAIYNLTGTQVGYLTAPGGIRYNNVDVRYGFDLDGTTVDLIASENRTSNTIDVYAIDPKREETWTNPMPLSVGEISVPQGVYGFTLYKSAKSGEYFAFVGSKEGRVLQYRLYTNETGELTGEQVREIKLASQVEGMVTDDAAGVLFVGEEERGIWKVSAEPDAPVEPTLISEISEAGPIYMPDVEGLTIYRAGDSAGYLIASSQGSGDYVVFTRESPHTHVGTFHIATGDSIDEVSDTDGIDVTNVPLGPAFPKGVFIAQDGYNNDGNQNFKLVPWENIARGIVPPLRIVTE